MGDTSETAALEAAELKAPFNSLTPVERIANSDSSSAKNVDITDNLEKSIMNTTISEPVAGDIMQPVPLPDHTLTVASETQSGVSGNINVVASSSFASSINGSNVESDKDTNYIAATPKSDTLPINTASRQNASTAAQNQPLPNIAGLDEYIRSPEVQNSIIERSPGGRYIRFMEKLGSGASKDVYRAYDTQEGIEVAWNVVNLAGVPKTERNRIVNEVRLLERLHHQNIISFHGSWVNRERQEVNFVTEILSSGTLKSFINKVQVIRWKIAKRWAVQILNGLEYLHSQEPPVIHRDLKCENIFINGTSGDLRIGDLGLSTVHRNGRVLSVLGTPEFMAPDMYEESSYDEKVDIYAFGMCMLEILTKEIPYAECRNAAQIYRKVSSGEPPEVLSRLQSKHARDFVVLCLGYKDENGKYVRPPVSELLKHPFLDKRSNDDDEVMVLERAIPGALADSDILLSAPLHQMRVVPTKSSETTTGGGSSTVPLRSPSAEFSDDTTGDTFENMQESEIKMRKVKVLMGRGQELEDDDEIPSRQRINEDLQPISGPLTVQPEALNRQLEQERLLPERTILKQTLSNENVTNVINLSSQVAHNPPISNNTTVSNIYATQPGQQSPVPSISQQLPVGGSVGLDHASSSIQQAQFQMRQQVAIADMSESTQGDQQGILIMASGQAISQQPHAVGTGSVNEQMQSRIAGPPFTQQLQHVNTVQQDQSQMNFNSLSNQQHPHAGTAITTGNNRSSVASFHQQAQSGGSAMYDQISQPAAFVMQQLQQPVTNLPMTKTDISEHPALLSTGNSFQQQGHSMGSMLQDQAMQPNLSTVPPQQLINGVPVINSHLQAPPSTRPIMFHPQPGNNQMSQQMTPAQVQVAHELPPMAPQQAQSYLVAAAVIEDENSNIRPYADDILKLVVTLPVDGQTQNVQFDFHLVEDDPVQVAKEMVQELAIPPGAVLEISETISGLARTARMKQDRHAVKTQQNSIHPQYAASVLHQNQPVSLRDQVPYHQASSAGLGSQHVQHHSQDSGVFIMQPPQHQVSMSGIGSTISTAVASDYSMASNPVSHMNHQQLPQALVGQSHEHGHFQHPSHLGQQSNLGSNGMTLENHMYVPQGTNQMFQGTKQGAMHEFQQPSAEYSNFHNQVFVQAPQLGQHASGSLTGSTEYTQYQYQPPAAGAAPIIPSNKSTLPSQLEYTEHEHNRVKSQDQSYYQGGHALPVINNVASTSAMNFSAHLASAHPAKVETPYSQQVVAGYVQTNASGEQSALNPSSNLQVPFQQHNIPSQSVSYRQSTGSSIDGTEPGLVANTPQGMSGQSQYGLQHSSTQSLPLPSVADTSVPGFVSQTSASQLFGTQARSIQASSQMQGFNPAPSLNVAEISSSVLNTVVVPPRPASSRPVLLHQNPLLEPHAPQTPVRAENGVKYAHHQNQDHALTSDKISNPSMHTTRLPGVSGSPSSNRQNSSDNSAIAEEGDDDSDDNNTGISEEMQKLEEEYQRNLQRAQKVYINRMDNLQRSQVERETQHQKTLMKHEKERADYERRLAQEEEQQNRRIEQLQREWEQKRETFAQIKRKQFINDGDKVQENCADSAWSSDEAI